LSKTCSPYCLVLVGYQKQQNVFVMFLKDFYKFKLCYLVASTTTGNNQSITCVFTTRRRYAPPATIRTPVYVKKNRTIGRTSWMFLFRVANHFSYIAFQFFFQVCFSILSLSGGHEIKANEKN